MKLVHTRAMRPLPPFDALVAFDAVLRHRSVTLAANELGVTQSAVSHRLRRLEEFIGTPLLLRSPNGLCATSAGVTLVEGLAELLEGLGNLRARCRAVEAPSVLRVGVGAALANYWLVRRLPSFAKHNPDIAIELLATENESAARAGNFDVLITWLPASSARASSTQRLLFQEQVFPVCDASILPDGATLADPVALAGMPLLHKGETGRSAEEWCWPVWYKRLGISAQPPAGLRFETIGTAIAAALQSAGVVLARSLLVHDALIEGRLVRVLPAQWNMPSSKAHIVRWPSAMMADKRVKTFIAWLIAEAQATSIKPVRVAPNA